MIGRVRTDPRRAVGRRDREPVERGEAERAPGAGRAPPSAGSAISMSGTCTTWAPSSASCSPSSPASGRVTAIRRPASGRSALTRVILRPPSRRRPWPPGLPRGRARDPRRRRPTRSRHWRRSGRRAGRAGRSTRGTSGAGRSAAWAPTGSAHPAPSSARKARSTVTASRVARSSRAASSSIVSSSSGARLDGNAALPDGGDEPSRVEAFGDAVGETEHLERGDRHHDRPAVGDPAETGGDVAAQLGEAEIGAHDGQLGAPPHRSRGHGGSLREVGQRHAR